MRQIAILTGLGCAAITLRVGYLMESVSKTMCRDPPPTAEAWLRGNGGGAVAANLLRAGSASSPSAVDRYISKRSGVQWSVWDRKSVLHGDLGTCRWKEFKPAGQTQDGKDGRAPTFMCLYPRGEDIYVSANIEDRGHWPNCNDITNQLRGIKNAVYMDIGANIGACVMQVLHTTDASVVAFEPSPKNLFRLTSTLLSLPEDMKNRVTLYPVALGDRPATAAIMADPKNAGNTQVKRSDEDQGRDGANVETHDIPVERLDDLLSSALNVDLLKLDVQGYECFVLNGMKQLLGSTQRVQFEVDDQLLSRHATGNACFGSRLVRTLQEADFEVSTENGAPVGDLTKKSYYHLKSVKFPTQDMYAVKQKLVVAA